MQRMREIIRGNLARSLRRCAEEDRLAAALPVVCGGALASHCEVERLDDQGTLHVRLDSAEWLHPLLAMREVMQHDLARVAGVALAGLHFVQPDLRPGSGPGRAARQPVTGSPAPVAKSGPGGPSRSDRTRRPA